MAAGSFWWWPLTVQEQWAQTGKQEVSHKHEEKVPGLQSTGTSYLERLQCLFL